MPAGLISTPIMPSAPARASPCRPHQHLADTPRPVPEQRSELGRRGGQGNAGGRDADRGPVHRRGGDSRACDGGEGIIGVMSETTGITLCSKCPGPPARPRRAIAYRDGVRAKDRRLSDAADPAVRRVVPDARLRILTSCLSDCPPTDLGMKCPRNQLDHHFDRSRLMGHAGHPLSEPFIPSKPPDVASARCPRLQTLDRGRGPAYHRHMACTSRKSLRQSSTPQSMSALVGFLRRPRHRQPFGASGGR